MSLKTETVNPLLSETVEQLVQIEQPPKQSSAFLPHLKDIQTGRATLTVNTP